MSDAAEKADKLRALKAFIDEGLQDIAAGRIVEWDFDAFLRRARNNVIPVTRASARAGIHKPES